MFKKWRRKRKVAHWKKEGMTEWEIGLELDLEDGKVSFAQYLTMKLFVEGTRRDIVLEELTSYIFGGKPVIRG